MPDDDLHDQDTDDERFVRVPRAVIRDLEDRARGAAGAQAMQRELSFIKAGVDVESRAGQLLLRAYDGDLTTEAIRAYAAEIPGAMREEPRSPEGADGSQSRRDGPTEEELALSRQRSELANGASGDIPPEVDVKETAKRVALESMQKGATEEEAVGHFVATMADAAMRGDRRVLVQDR